MGPRRGQGDVRIAGQSPAEELADLMAALFTASLPAGAPESALLALDAEAPVTRSEELRAAVRDMLRQGGYKPTGRGKPASEYLVRGKVVRQGRPLSTCASTTSSPRT